MKHRLLQESTSVITLSLFLSFLFVACLSAETFRTPKKFSNLHQPAATHNEDLFPSKPPYAFQNDYQHRSGRSRLGSSALFGSASNAGSAPAADGHRLVPFRPHLMAEPGNEGGGSLLDYFYSDHRPVPTCRGRVLLNGTRGVVTDGDGHYERNLQCTWLIDSPTRANDHNATIRIRIYQFNTECNYDHLYIFDGNSLYSPLLASLSGDMKDFSRAYQQYPAATSTDQISSTSTTASSTRSTYLSSYKHNSSAPEFFEIVARSGRALIYFHSDTAETRPGFYITYTIDSCPLDCSQNGLCEPTTLQCKCNPGFHGEGCQHIVCPNRCSAPINGVCDNDRSVCVCNTGYYGEDCSLELEHQIWTNLELAPNSGSPLARAFHQAVVVEDTMWVFGGKDNSLSYTRAGIHRKQKTSIIYSFNLATRQWTDVVLEGTTGVDHLAQLSGHSVAALESKVFIFGGLAPNNTVLDKLSVFDTKTRSLSILSTDKKSKSTDKLAAPLAVNGHSANIVDGHMYIFFGYNPLYGNLNLVQKFNLADNTWSLVKSKGTFVRGTVGHTSTYDVVNRLIYVLGGNSHPSSKVAQLLAFDPYTDTWTRLHSELDTRIQHSSLVIDRQLVVLGGSSYIMTNEGSGFKADKERCYADSVHTYDLTCATRSSLHANSYSTSNSTQSAATTGEPECGSRRCWHSMEDDNFDLLRRSGSSVVQHGSSGNLLLYGGFNGLYLNDLLTLKLGSCSDYHWQSKCLSHKLGLKCYWNPSESKCEDQSLLASSNSTAPFVVVAPQNAEHLSTECSDDDRRELQSFCRSQDTCSDCLHTNAGCVWCGQASSCNHGRCRGGIGASLTAKPLTDAKLCYKDDNSRRITHLGSSFEEVLVKGDDTFWEIGCRRLTNCHSCQFRPQCSWTHSDTCNYSHQDQFSSSSSSSSSSLEPIPPDDILLDKLSSSDADEASSSAPSQPAPVAEAQRATPYSPLDPVSIMSALQGSSSTSQRLTTSSHRPCDTPCYLRSSCSECNSGKCVWCSATDQCIYSPAYSSYYSMGQCIHYIAHAARCPAATCDMLTCDECLTNPRCGWLNDVSNTGRGKCMEGVAAGPMWMLDTSSPTANSSAALSFYASSTSDLPQWHYHSCPSCQCNGHSQCKPNTNHCSQPCQNNTDGPHCDRCMAGYYGKPINGGHCKPCQCNGHAEACSRETGKCFCSTKGIIGDNCNMCDEANHYIGNPMNPHNETCHYNLTTDYQYIFNMSKPEDHFYSDINFINVPLRKDSDVDFTIVCSRFALVNITSGTSYRNRKPIHTALECGSFRLRFPHERHILSETNYSFFVRVYDFQTPFILQIAFSQHRTLYLPQFFFTFSSCFLFFCGLSGIVWKLKHEYDLYNRRQRQFIEMEQMASRPFSSIPLELSSKSAEIVTEQKGFQTEPTPISYQPCFGSNIGVLSFFVQLPGRPNLAIGSALVNLNDETNLSNELGGNNNATTTNKRSEKDVTNLKE